MEELHWTLLWELSAELPDPLWAHYLPSKCSRSRSSLTSII